MKVVCFDLDDTLYKEIDFLKSAFKEIVEYGISHSGRHDLGAADLYEGMLGAYFSKKDAFDYLIAAVGSDLDKATLLSLYRNHVPQISLSDGAFELITEIRRKGYEIGIITDGRSVQQRNKIKALGLSDFVSNENVVISEEFGSEKPSRANYEYFITKYPEASDFYYIADNPKKDFISPNALGWKTVCVKDDGRNIHTQQMDLLPEYLPKLVIPSLSVLFEVI